MKLIKKLIQYIKYVLYIFIFKQIKRLCAPQSLKITTIRNDYSTSIA